MEVHGPESNPYLSIQGRTPEKPKTKKGKASGFLDKLRLKGPSELAETAATSGAGEPATVDEALDILEEAEKNLKKSATQETITGYRKALSAVLKRLEKHIYSTEEHNSGTSVLKQKKFTIITVINEKLEAFVGRLLSGQQDQLFILEKMEELHGLVVDVLQ